MTDAPGVDALVDRARVAFRERFGREPRWFGVAPGRVNLMGDHVDYAGGLVLPMAIDRWTVAAGDFSTDPARPQLFAADLSESGALDLTAGVDECSAKVLGAHVGHWSGYVAGVFHQLISAEPGGNPPAIDLAITSSVPRASGLSSSAALELAVASVLNHAWGLQVSSRDLALACQRAEHVGGGVKCGIMDQFASALGEEGRAIILDCRDHRVTPVVIAADLRVLVVDTRTPRQLSAGKYAELVARLSRVEQLLGTPLRRVTMEQIAGAETLAPDERASALHFVQETARVHEAGVDLAAGNAEALARSFAASHASLRDRLGVSSPALDAAVSAATEVGCDVGARLTGAGMGGCAVVVCPRGRSDEVGRHVAGRFEKVVGHRCVVLPVRGVAGARVFQG